VSAASFVTEEHLSVSPSVVSLGQQPIGTIPSTYIPGILFAPAAPVPEACQTLNSVNIHPVCVCQDATLDVFVYGYRMAMA
jgi:hypothetical protein